MVSGWFYFAGATRHAVVRRRVRAMTLVEMLLAITILSIVGAAVCTLTYGAMSADRYSRNSNTGQSEVELAMRGIANNIKEGQTVTVTSNTITTLTQADAAHGYSSGATVVYSIVADPSNAGQNMLIENDQRYGTNTLVHNVTTFTVAALNGSSGLYQVDLVAGTQFVAERHFQVFNRN